MARNFPRFEGDPPRGVLATAVWELVTLARPELIIDLHEGFDFHRRTGRSLGSSILYAPIPAAERLVPGIADAVNRAVSLPSKQFDLIPKPIVGSVIDAAWRRLGIAGVVFETTKAGQSIELRVEQQLTMAWALLRQLDMLPPNERGGACPVGAQP